MSGSGHELLFVKGYRLFIGCFLALELAAVQMLGEELLFRAFLLSTLKQPQASFLPLLQ